MKFTLAFCGLLLTSVIAHAGPVLVTGTPSDSYDSPAITKPSPYLGGVLLNFDSLSPLTLLSQYSSSGVTITSPDGLEVYPYSTQSGPNELYDDSAAGSADIFIDLSGGSKYIGVGIADSDITAAGSPVNITLQALAAGEVFLGVEELVGSTEGRLPDAAADRVAEGLGQVAAHAIVRSDVGV